MKTLAFAAALAILISSPANAQKSTDAPPPPGIAKWCDKPFTDEIDANVDAWAPSDLQTRWFAALSDMHKQTNSEKCNTLNGRSQLGNLSRGLRAYLKTSKAWDKNLELISAYKKEMPNDALAAILEATYWEIYAWDARGHGYASSVSADGWKLFRDRLAKAEKLLVDSKPYASSSPLWYNEMLIVQSAQDSPQRERDATLVEGVKKFPWYVSLYLTRAEYLAPWWGGDWDSIDNLAVWSVNQTRATMGNAMYVHIYSAMSNPQHVKNIFEDTKASWQTMKSGFDDLMRQFPESRRNLNFYARFACDAGDKQVYLKLRKKLVREAIDDSLWGAKHHEVCDAKFGYTI